MPQHPETTLVKQLEGKGKWKGGRPKKRAGPGGNKRWALKRNDESQTGLSI